jgi:hypothetical protein
MSKGAYTNPAITWKNGVVALVMLLGFIGPLNIAMWLWGAGAYCPAIPMFAIMENINDKMSKPNPDGGADLIWGTGVCTIYLKPYDEQYDEVES